MTSSFPQATTASPPPPPTPTQRKSVLEDAATHLLLNAFLVGDTRCFLFQAQKMRLTLYFEEVSFVSISCLLFHDT